MPRRLPVVDREGNHVMWVDEDRARELIKATKVELVWTKKRVRMLRVVDKHVAAKDLAPGHSRPTRYSHNHEVAETYIGEDGKLHARHPLDANPKNCWTLKRLSKSLRSIFTEVLDGCTQPRRAA